MRLDGAFFRREILTWLEARAAYAIKVQFYQWIGLRDLRWHPPRVAPDGLARYGPGFWDDFLEMKPVVCLECRK